MNNPLGVSPSKGKQGTTRGKERLFMGLSSTIIYTSELILCSTIDIFYSLVKQFEFCFKSCLRFVQCLEEDYFLE